MKAAVGHPSWGIQIGIAVPLRRPTPDGLPDSSEFAELDQIEDQIVRLVGDRAVMVGVISTGGMREFVLYTGSSDWIEGFHRSLEAAVQTYEVQVMAQQDDDWSVYRRFV